MTIHEISRWNSLLNYLEALPENLKDFRVFLSFFSLFVMSNRQKLLSVVIHYVSSQHECIWLEDHKFISVSVKVSFCTIVWTSTYCRRMFSMLLIASFSLNFFLSCKSCVNICSDVINVMVTTTNPPQPPSKWVKTQGKIFTKLLFYCWRMPGGGVWVIWENVFHFVCSKSVVLTLASQIRLKNNILFEL